MKDNPVRKDTRREERGSVRTQVGVIQELSERTDSARGIARRQKQKGYPPEAGNLAVSVVRFLIEQQSLTQRDLIPEFGSESAVSMFLAGERKLTVEQIRKLSSRFKLSADILIQGL